MDGHEGETKAKYHRCLEDLGAFQFRGKLLLAAACENIGHVPGRRRATDHDRLDRVLRDTAHRKSMSAQTLVVIVGQRCPSLGQQHRCVRPPRCDRLKQPCFEAAAPPDPGSIPAITCDCCRLTVEDLDDNKVSCVELRPGGRGGAEWKGGRNRRLKHKVRAELEECRLVSAAKCSLMRTATQPHAALFLFLGNMLRVFLCPSVIRVKAVLISI
ncbi:hypothetical protein EYF80_011685 [Liparis tanakae]|uniref:Uncharacterized protein n=1 Tax=Liparis tanakae TaxID=230148 RepID=A0A4Z2IJJ0_9TELE|nr:hypothetical protein EYF80_011685 [Liparis tanakae]